MKLERIPYEPGALLQFYEEALSSLGALCERTWHDRLQVVAEGAAARLWTQDDNLHACELFFAAPDATSARDASLQVFPGCPLTFRLADQLRPSPILLERVSVAGPGGGTLPHSSVLEKLWRVQIPGTGSWQLSGEPTRSWHFSVVALVRAEIQAIDQHWSLHRLAISLPAGEADDELARDLPFLQIETQEQIDADAEIRWPAFKPHDWTAALERALRRDLQADLDRITKRQELFLRRELDRIDEFFAHYEKELIGRADRGLKKAASERAAERVQAARAEHARRRNDQLSRHEIHIRPHIDGLLLVAEPAWSAGISLEIDHKAARVMSTFVPRTRRWFGWL